MIDWLLRLVGWHEASGPPARAPLPTPQSTDAASTGPADAAAHAGFGQRRPLVGRTGRVAGFEWRLPAALEQRLAARPDDRATAAHYAALLGAAAAGTLAPRTPLVVVPAALLAVPGVVDRSAVGMMLLPTGPGPVDAAAARALRARGAFVGVPDGPPMEAPAADFVLLRAAAGGLDTLLLSAQRWREARPRVPLLALGLDSVADVEKALAGGITLAGGRLQSTAQTAASRPLSAAAHRICVLLNDLALDRPTSTVGEAVRSDVALSYRLLRYANSPAIGLRQSVDSVEFAVDLLGRAELSRWLSVMLLSAAGGRQASAALQEHALARGRLMEALARTAGEPRPQALFTLGMLSRLDGLMQMPLAAALEPLRLNDEARLALLQRQGPWSVYLDIADELEGEDEVRFGQLCAPFGGIDAVLGEAEKAWGWAAEVVGLQQG